MKVFNFQPLRRLAEWLQAEADEADESEGEEDEEEDEELNQIESMAQRAPRPTFHLLRLSDVSRALSDASAGDTVTEQNLVTAREIGVEGWQELMQACEEKKGTQGVRYQKHKQRRLFMELWKL